MAYERKKPQIILLDRWEKTVVDDLTDEEAGKILKAMYRYFHHGEQPAFQDRLLRFFWEDVTKWLDDSREWYEDLCASRSEAGKIGAAKRWGTIASDSTSQQRIASDSTSQQTDGKNSIDIDKAIDKAIDNDNAQRLMPKAQGAMPKAKHSASDNDNHPSNIQSTSIITEGAGKSSQQPPAAENAQGEALKAGAKSLDGWKEKDPQREAEALRINPGNFKKHYRGADDLDGKTVIRYCKLRSDMIRNGADPAEVDRGIQKEISGA